MRRLAVLLIGIVLPLAVSAQQGGRGGPPRDSGAVSVLRPARVFDGQSMHEGWAVRVRGERIEAAGPADTVGVAGGGAGGFSRPPPVAGRGGGGARRGPRPPQQ